MKRIFDRYQRMPKNDICSSYVGLCGTRVTRPLILVSFRNERHAHHSFSIRPRDVEELDRDPFLYAVQVPRNLVA